MKIRRLDIECLRGIPKGWPSVAISDQGLIIYGPNGSGKSSVIDGLEFALGKDSSLYPEARQGVDWERGAPNIFGGSPQARLTCIYNGQEVDLASDEAGVEAIASWKAAAKSATYVLRRHMLLKFILSRPAERYGSLEAFFNLGAYTTLEGKLESLKNAAARVESSLQAHLTAKSQTARIALGFSGSEVINNQTAAAKLSEVLSAAGLSSVDTEDDRAARKGEVESELRGLVTDERLTQLATLKSHLAGLVTTSTYGPLIDKFVEFQTTLITAREQSTNVVPVELLRTAQSLIASNHMSVCPVCEQDIDENATIASLGVRISSDLKVSNAKNDLEQQRQSVVDAINGQAAAFQKLVLLWSQTMGGELPRSYQDEINILTDFGAILKNEEIVPNIGDFATALRSTIGSHQVLRDAVDEELATAGGTRRAVLARVLEVINVIDTQLAGLESARNQFAIASKTLAQLERIQSHALQARRNAVQSIVGRLAALSNEYYEFIHPGEKIAESSLAVRQVGKGSVELTTTFYGSRENPLLHFSESHLDTLGLCYFLAARRLEAAESGSFKLLILDDVVHSVDADHRDRIARLLKEHFSDHQIVIVTHDSIFYQRLRAVLGGQYEHLYFVNWTLEEGPIRIEASTDIDRITSPELRNASSPEELASAGGRFAEWLFRELNESLQVAVQARFSRGHDLGTLWPPLASKLKKHKGITAASSAAVTRIDTNQWVRNKVGAHYNEPESPVTPAEVREFAEGLSELFQITFCEACATPVAKIDDKTCSCRCGLLKYASSEEGNEASPSGS